MKKQFSILVLFGVALAVITMFSCSGKKASDDSDIIQEDTLQSGSYGYSPDRIEDNYSPSDKARGEEIIKNIRENRKAEEMSVEEKAKRLERIRKYEYEDEGLGVYDDETDEHIDYEGEDDENNIYDPIRYSVDESDFDMDD